ncbi:hypothetical protein UABAM_00663 [Candidatus Uabimicrobium amorphum]|uniref:Ferric oxidoreductase domain-containing protein n=1 Tax=Uabimicrobium amorphum TaxID=2596890 RepID=A0A5S9IJR0_UABAM|nr:hypothetical protein UABAM_00663 [Candidatus Uabimicrobium amorphum]
MIVTLLVNLFYAILRYNVFGNVPWEQLPLYVVNKAVSFSAIFCISLSVVWSKLPSKKIQVRKFLGLYGFALAIFHVLLSVILLNPEYYSTFFDGQKINLRGNIIILCGALAFMSFLIAASCSIVNSPTSLLYIRPCVTIAIIFAATHIFFRGKNTWINPYNWYGYMPPISLLSFTVVIIAIASKAYTKK